MNRKYTLSKAQEVLLATVHNQNSVLEVYFNNQKNTITELHHLSNHRVKVYEYEIEDYKSSKNLSFLGKI